jgi:hypothetical protein
MRQTPLGAAAVLCAIALPLAPGLRQPSPAVRLVAGSVDDFRLPPKSVFDRSMPRYPNVWFYVDSSLAPTYETAVKAVTDRLRSAMRLREFFPPFDNPEGCDFETPLEHLQPWYDKAAPPLQHAHAFHMRYYYSALERQRTTRVELQTSAGNRSFYRFAASVHYEVEHHNPHHADVETCPICGRTGTYRDLTGNLVELVHDPLGLELLMKGTIRGEVVRFEDQDQRPVGSIAGLSGVDVQSYEFPGLTADRNTLRIGVIVVSGARRLN